MSTDASGLLLQSKVLSVVSNTCFVHSVSFAINLYLLFLSVAESQSIPLLFSIAAAGYSKYGSICVEQMYRQTFPLSKSHVDSLTCRLYVHQSTLPIAQLIG